MFMGVAAGEAPGVTLLRAVYVRTRGRRVSIGIKVKDRMLMQAT